MFLQQIFQSILISILLTVTIGPYRHARALNPSGTASLLTNLSADFPESSLALMADSKRIDPEGADGERADGAEADNETPAGDTLDVNNNEFSEPSELLFQIQGTLESGDLVTFQDGSLYDEYPLDGIAGQALMITLESDDFDSYLVVLSDSGEMIAQNDDIAQGGTNSSILVTLPKTDQYLVIASGFKYGSRGRYQLTIWTTPDTNADLDSSPAVIPEF